MHTTADLLKRKIENLTPELLKTVTRMVESLEMENSLSIPQFQLDEVLYRIQFHDDYPKTKLDFYENISELKKSIA